MSTLTPLTPAPVSTECFTYDAATCTFTAEASSLPLRGFGRVWDDSCDEGLTLVSHRTGDEVVFVLEHVEVDDGDIRWWELRSVTGTRTDGRWTVTIFND